MDYGNELFNLAVGVNKLSAYEAMSEKIADLIRKVNDLEKENHLLREANEDLIERCQK